MGFIWICKTDNGNYSHSSNPSRHGATAPHVATTVAARTLRTDTGTALDDGRVTVHRTGGRTTCGALLLSRPYRPPWLSCRRLLGVAKPCGRVYAGYWRLACCSVELPRQQTHDCGHAVQAVALLHAGRVVRGPVHVIGDFLALPILDKLDPRQVQTVLAGEGDILSNDGIVKTLTQCEETLPIGVAVRGCVRAGAGGFTALTTLRRAELKAATGIGPYGIQKLAIDDLDAGDGGFGRLDILL